MRDQKMEFFNGRRNKRQSLILAMIGLSLISMAVAIVVLDPIQLIVDYKLSMFEGSFLFKLWEKPPLDVYIKVFVFNITNLDRFMSGRDKKVKLQEIGPYVYQEFLENTNAVFNDNNTLTYKPVRRVEFVPEMSIGDPKKDVITVPNIPYMGVTTAASKISFIAAVAIRTLMRTLHSEIVLNVTVHDYFWGYEDNLIRLASSLLPGVIHFETFGLLDRMFDEGDNLVTINLPGTKSKKADNSYLEQNSKQFYVSNQNFNEVFKSFHETSKKFIQEGNNQKEIFKPNIRDYSINTWNGKTGLSSWGHREGKTSMNSECNTLQGSYDGTLFPRNITPGEVFRIYRKPFCRTLPIVYSHPGRVDGIDAYFFKLADNAFDSDAADPKTSCFCKSEVCLKRGLGNISPCYYNIPAAVSFPHFFNADPSLLDDVDGLNPNEKDHGSEIVLQPQLGIPMKVHSRLQINLLMGEVKFNYDMKPFQNTVLPIIWLEIGVESLTPGLILLLKFLFNICPYIQGGAIYLFILGGISVLGMSALIFLCIPDPKKEFNPKKHITYSAMYIFPYIQKELKKCNEDEECIT